MKRLSFRSIIPVLVLIAIAVGAYFVNVEVQSLLGRRALEKTGLQSLPLDAALVRAKTENRLVLVDVAAIWCPTCRRLDNDVFADPEVRRALAERYVFARLEYESAEGAAFLEKHNATGFPNLWVLDQNGDVVRHLRVTFVPKEFIAELP